MNTLALEVRTPVPAARDRQRPPALAIVRDPIPLANGTFSAAMPKASYLVQEH